MKKTHRVAPEVKQEILGKIKEQGLTVKQAVEQYGVSDNTIYGWLSKGATGAPTWGELNRVKRENQQLLNLVGELTVKLSTAQKKS
ncbi:MAG: transposase [Candidatus Binatia bacterium]